MAKKKVSKSAAFSKDRKVVGLNYGPEVNNFSALIDDLDSKHNHIRESIVAAIIGIVIMVQIRFAKADDSHVNIDKSPSYKFYKKRLMISSPGLSYALMLACSSAAAFMPDDPDERLDLFISLLDSYSGNTRFIETLSKNSLVQYIHGHMSRSLGILNSCPASNPAMLGLDKECMTWGIDDVYKLLPDFLQKAKKQDVVNIIRSECKTEGTNILLAEKPLNGPNTKQGCTILESEVFGDCTPVRSKSSLVSDYVGESGKMPEGSISKADLERYLSPLQQKKYVACAKLGLTADLVKYNEIVKKAKASEIAAANDKIEETDESVSESSQMTGGVISHRAVATSVVYPRHRTVRTPFSVYGSSHLS